MGVRDRRHAVQHTHTHTHIHTHLRPQRPTGTCVASAAVLSCALNEGETGLRHPFVRKVMSSAGFSSRDTINWMKTLQRHGRYDRACQELHPGQPSCTKALLVGVPAVTRSAVRDIAYLYVLLCVRAMSSGHRRPSIAPLGRTLAFCVLAFSTIRVSVMGY